MCKEYENLKKQRLSLIHIFRKPENSPRFINRLNPGPETIRAGVPRGWAFTSWQQYSVLFTGR